ncbi:MAG: cyclic nucleotide-binding/CBS domain-containing protein [Thermoproteota archaeon]
MSGIISVNDIMTKDVKMVGRDTSMQAVLDMMLKFDISSVVVVQKKKPVGIITHTDLLIKMIKPVIPSDALTAGQVMTSPVITIGENASIEEAAKVMSQNRIKKLPVIRDEKMVGIVTSMDLILEQPRMVKLLEDLRKPYSE